MDELPDEVKKIAAQYLTTMAAMFRGESDICPRCGKPHGKLEKIGRSVYGECGCRIYQGELPTRKGE